MIVVVGGIKGGSGKTTVATNLAVIRAAAGLNPLAAARQARSLSPLDTDVLQVWQTFSSSRPRQWPSDGMRFINQYTL